MFRKPIPFRLSGRHPRADEILSSGLLSADRTYNGLARVEGDDLVLQFRVTDHVMDTSGMSGLSQETDTSDAQELRVPLAHLASAKCKGWFGRKVTLVAMDLTEFEALGATDGRLVLKVSFKHRSDAEQLATALAFRISDLELEGIDEDIRRLESG